MKKSTAANTPMMIFIAFAFGDDYRHQTLQKIVEGKRA
jgi:hypothetical protein